LESPVVVIYQDKDNTMFESALKIPNHTVSWAIYQVLGHPDNVEARFYKFDNEKPNSSFYAQITVPKIDTFVNFAPSLLLIGPASDNIDDIDRKDPVTHSTGNSPNSSSGSSNEEGIHNQVPFKIPPGYQVLINSPYEGPIPSPIFYERFTQTSYWERQEVKTRLNGTGTHYVVVFNAFDNPNGKFSLAVGEKEDFALLDFFTLLPYSWVKVKLFFNDYLSIFVMSIIFVFFVVVLPVLAIRIHRRKKSKKENIGN
jgi:hypothetical protein